MTRKALDRSSTTGTVCRHDVLDASIYRGSEGRVLGEQVHEIGIYAVSENK